MELEYYYDPRGDPRSLLVINRVGILRRIYTPFRVQCITPIHSMTPGTQVYVDEVHGGLHGELYFMIFKQPYQHKHFRLLVQF